MLPAAIAYKLSETENKVWCTSWPAPAEMTAQDFLSSWVSQKVPIPFPFFSYA